MILPDILCCNSSYQGDDEMCRAGLIPLVDMTELSFCFYCKVIEIIHPLNIIYLDAETELHSTQLMTCHK